MDKQENKFFDAWLAAVGDNWNTPAGRDIVWRSRANKAPALLAKIITDKNTSAKDKDRFMRSLDFIKGPEKDAALVERCKTVPNRSLAMHSLVSLPCVAALGPQGGFELLNGAAVNDHVGAAVVDGLTRETLGPASGF